MGYFANSLTSFKSQTNLNQNGSSLVIILSTLAVSSLLMMSLMSLSELWRKISKSLDINQTVSDFANLINSISKDTALCDVYFSGVQLDQTNPNPQAPGTIPTTGDNFPMMSAPLQPGSRIGIDLQVSSVVWTDARALQPASYTQGGFTYRPTAVTLMIVLDDLAVTTNRSIGGKDHTVTITNLQFYTRRAGAMGPWTISSCITSGVPVTSIFYPDWDNTDPTGCYSTATGLCNPGYFGVATNASFRITTCCSIPSE